MRLSGAFHFARNCACGGAPQSVAGFVSSSSRSWLRSTLGAPPSPRDQSPFFVGARDGVVKHNGGEGAYCHAGFTDGLDDVGEPVEVFSEVEGFFPESLGGFFQFGEYSGSERSMKNAKPRMKRLRAELRFTK